MSEGKIHVKVYCEQFLYFNTSLLIVYYRSDDTIKLINNRDGEMRLLLLSVNFTHNKKILCYKLLNITSFSSIFLATLQFSKCIGVFET